MDTTAGEASVKTHNPLVFVIGTHKDKLGASAEEKISKLNEYLSSLIQRSRSLILSSLQIEKKVR